MAVKRKRSIDDSPLSISSFGAVSTPEMQSPTPFPHRCDGAMDIDHASRPHAWDFASASRVKSSDWGNRTRKRFRDNRPDERAIHENTLHKLFSAQRQHPEASPVPSETLPPPQPSVPASRPQKSTLHSFWKQLPAPPVQPPTFPPYQPNISSDHLRCEDCDASLYAQSDSMDLDMDMDMGGAVEVNPFACTDCGKSVCGTCVVVSARRHCLGCATRGRDGSRWW